MLIKHHSVVTLQYSVKDDSGRLLEQTSEAEPMAYIQGTQTILPVLERSLEGKKEGDEISLRIPMEEAYGPRREELISVVSRKQFANDADVQVGRDFYYVDEDENVVSVTIVGVQGDEVTVDGNHPFAGMDLNFDIRVVGVRDATPEELEHGHVHGPGGTEH